MSVSYTFEMKSSDYLVGQMSSGPADHKLIYQGHHLWCLLVLGNGLEGTLCCVDKVGVNYGVQRYWCMWSYLCATVDDVGRSLRVCGRPPVETYSTYTAVLVYTETSFCLNYDIRYASEKPMCEVLLWSTLWGDYRNAYIHDTHRILRCLPCRLIHIVLRNQNYTYMKHLFLGKFGQRSSRPDCAKP